MEGIYRPTTESDKRFFDNDLNKKDLTAHERFILSVKAKEKEATKKHLPFASKAAMEDFQNAINEQVAIQKRKYGGSVTQPIEIPKIELDKYMDLKNFEVVKEDEVFDTDLSRKNPGLSVMLKKTEYRFKEYGDIYRVMEEPQEAIRRAQEAQWKTRQEVIKPKGDK